MLRFFSLTILLFFAFVFFIFPGEAQVNPERDEGSSEDATANFPPNLAFVLVIFCIMVALTLVLLIYTRFCHGGSRIQGDSQSDGSLIRSGSRDSGIDKTVIESLPFFRFSSLKGSKRGLECAVCLSKFEDFEVLRFLPKCQHAFHRNCIDQWLEKHSSCPLCRCKVSADDMTMYTYSNSTRFLTNQSELQEGSNMELFVQREESRLGSSGFSIGSSFRKIEKVVKKDEEALIQKTEAASSDDDGSQVLHKFNHKIIVSDVVFNNRWSNLSSSDLMCLNSEMLQDISSRRFSSLDSDNKQFQATETCQMMKIKEEMEETRSFGNHELPNPVPGDPSKSSESGKISGHNRWGSIIPVDRRSVSEITGLSRFKNFSFNPAIRDSFPGENRRKEEKLRQLWLPIVRKTVEWFANRERTYQQTDTLHV